MTERKIVTQEAVAAAKKAAGQNFGTLMLTDAQIELLLQDAGRVIAAKAIADFADYFKDTAEAIGIPKSFYLQVTAIAKRYATDVENGRRLR